MDEMFIERILDIVDPERFLSIENVLCTVSNKFNKTHQIFQTQQVKDIVLDLLLIQSKLVGFTCFNDIDEAFNSFQCVIDKINKLKVV